MTTAFNTPGNGSGRGRFGLDDVIVSVAIRIRWSNFLATTKVTTCPSGHCFRVSRVYPAAPQIPTIAGQGRCAMIGETGGPHADTGRCPQDRAGARRSRRSRSFRAAELAHEETHLRGAQTRRALSRPARGAKGI